MPTVINLKDLTSSDSQITFAEKINFNFNQLLSLGVGSQGPRGQQGPGGPPGPLGLPGPTGPRGSKWYTFSDLSLAAGISPYDVEFVPPSDLLYGDIYTTGTFDVYEYRLVGATGSWVQIVDHTTLFNTSNVSTALIRDFVVGGSANPTSERFITFVKYNGSDRGGNDSASSDTYFNDMLFLHNFDQTRVSSDFNGTNIAQFYTALENIYVDHSNSSNDMQVRNHLELGSLYNDGTLKITKNNENLKIKFKIDSGTRLSSFNASKNDGDGASTLGNFNSAFKFSISKWVSNVHTTLDYALVSSEKIRQFTDTNFEQIDGLSLKNDVTKVAFGIKNIGGTMYLALVGNTGTGAPVGIYSNLPLSQLGSVAGSVQIQGDTIEFTDGTQKTIKTTSDDLQILSGRGEAIKLQNNSLELSADSGLSSETSVKIKPAGKIGVGKSSIAVNADKVPATSTSTPTANLMVNGSFAAGLRRITASSTSGEMILTGTDMTVHIEQLPAGSDNFDLGVSDSSNTLRFVCVVNATTSSIDIKSSGVAIGTLIAGQTALYQSFGSQWFLLMTGANTLATSGGGSGATQNIWVSMALSNIRTEPFNYGNSFGYFRYADISFSFYSDQAGTLIVPVNNLQLRLTITEDRTVNGSSGSNTTTSTNTQYLTANGGSPQILLNGVQIGYSVSYINYIDGGIYGNQLPQPGAGETGENSTTMYFLESKKSDAPKNTKQGSADLLDYLRVGETA